MAVAGPRRRAREVALQVLVQMDVSPELDAGRALALYFEHLAPASTAPVDDDADEDAGGIPGARAAAPFDRQLVEDLVRGVAAERAVIDEIAQALSTNWRLERMALIDRNVIRLGIHELRQQPPLPVGVAINEAIELCKRYGTAEGAAFVNGLLDRAATDPRVRR